MKLCVACGVNEVSPRAGTTGRPRTRCDRCRRSHEGFRKLNRYRLKIRHWKPKILRGQPPERPVRVICGCGRDYLTVPLEEANHLCPEPIVLD